MTIYSGKFKTMSNGAIPFHLQILMPEAIKLKEALMVDWARTRSH